MAPVMEDKIKKGTKFDTDILGDILVIVRFFFSLKKKQPTLTM